MDGRTTRHAGYAHSHKLVEQVYGWVKTVGGGRKLRFVGLERNRCWLELTAAAYNLVRMASLETLVGAVRSDRPGALEGDPQAWSGEGRGGFERLVDDASAGAC